MGVINFITLQDISQAFLIKIIINSQLKERYDLSQEKNEIMGEIIEITYLLPKDLDTALYSIFKYPFPIHVVPLGHLIKEKITEMNIIFYYGEADWIDNSRAKSLNIFNKNKYKWFPINNAGNTFLLYHPGELAKILLHEL